MPIWFVLVASGLYVALLLREPPWLVNTIPAGLMVLWLPQIFHCAGRNIIVLIKLWCSYGRVRISHRYQI